MSADDSEDLGQFSLGDNLWPPDDREGWAEVKFSAEYDIDKQVVSGKGDPTIKNKGRTARKFSAVLHWTNRIDDLAREYLEQISPVGVNEGKPWEIDHPDVSIYNVNAVQILTMGEISRTACERTVTIGGISWHKQAPAKVGTAKASNKAVEWKNAPIAKDHVTFKTSDGNTVDMGPGPITKKTSDGNTYGFGAPDAPAAEVPP